MDSSQNLLEKKESLLPDVLKPALMKYDTIIGAYNQEHCHWCLIIIRPKAKQILFLNPLGTLQVQEQDIVLKWFNFLKMRCDAGLEHDLPDAWDLLTPNHAKQFDGISCGVYVLKFADNYLEGRPLDFLWNALDVEKARLSLAVFLLSISQPRACITETETFQPGELFEMKKLKPKTQRYPNREERPKRKKQRQELHCICEQSDDGRKYWCCDGCDSWYHPVCVGKTEEEEKDHFLCPYCMDTDIDEDEKTRINDKEDEVSDEDDRKAQNSRRIVKKTVKEKYPAALEQLREFLTCADLRCYEDDHQRHHQFLAEPFLTIKKQKRKFGFGRDYFSQTTAEDLTEKITEDLLYNVLDEKNPATSLRSMMIRCVPAKSALWNLFIENKLLAPQYIRYVLSKEVMVFIASIHGGAPYQKCQAICNSTEIDSKKMFGI